MKRIYLTVGRVDNGPHSRDSPKRDFPHHESCSYWSSFMSVITFQSFDSSVAYTDFLFISRSGPRLSDFKFSLRAKCRKMWPHHQLVSEAFQAVRSPSIRVSMLLNSILALFHAYYRTFPLRFNKKWNSSDPYLTSGWRSWRSMERTGTISRFVRPLSRYLISHQMADL